MKHYIPSCKICVPPLAKHNDMIWKNQTNGITKLITPSLTVSNLTSDILIFRLLRSSYKSLGLKIFSSTYSSM